MNQKVLYLLFIILQIPVIGQVSDMSMINPDREMQTKIEVLYDSVVEYIFPTPLDSVYRSKIIFDYDNICNKITREHVYYWEEEDENWQSSSKREYMYDDYCNKILNAEYAWDNILNEWRGFQKREYSFSDTVKSETIYGNWESARKDFDGQVKYKRYFDNNRESIYEVTLWDNLRNEWFLSTRNYYEYNTSGKKNK